jgi:hypothetical protein
MSCTPLLRHASAEDDSPETPAPATPESTRSVAAARWCGAVVWVAFGAFMVLRVPDGWWRWRDDGVITLSHARGVVEFGHPAVSASGARVDGSSAPLQMLLAAAFYRLGGGGWRRLMDVQVAASFALAGWSAGWLLALVVPARRTRRYVGATAAAAVLGFTAWRSVGWFSSGMENGITVALLLLVMASTTAAILEPTSRGWLAFGLAGISRVEFAGLLLPALAVSIVALRARPAVAIRVVAVAGACWLVVHGWRWFTFGSLVPNTAVVQGKVGVDDSAIWRLALCALLLATVLLLWQRRRARTVTSAVVITVAAVGTWTALRGDRYDVWGIDRLVVMSALGLVIVIAAGWMAAVGRRSVWAVLMAVAAAPLAQRMLFGRARLDAERISTMALPLLGVCAALVILAATEASHTRSAVDATTEPRGRSWAAMIARTSIVAIAVVGAAASYLASVRDEPQLLCCAIDGHVEVLDEAASITNANGFAAAIVATPDLGKLSFDKLVVNVDLGYLGDPLLTQIHEQRPDLVDDYLTMVAAPDLVELHGSWACTTYRRWITSAEFEQRYRLLRAAPDGTTDGCPHGGARQLYVRVDDTAHATEMALSAALTAELLNAARLVGEAYTACRGDDAVARCAAVRRAVVRSMPALRADDALQPVIAAAIAASPTPRLERLLLEAPPRWAELAAPELIALLASAD